MMGLVLMGLVFSAAARAVPLLADSDLADPALWVPYEGSPAAETVVTEGRRAVRMPAPFSKLDGWRYGWDLEFERTLAAHKYLKLTVKADDPEAVEAVILYFESGGGWYRIGMGAPGKDWTVLTRPRAKADSEGSPGSWDGVTRLRIAILPAARRDTVVYVAGLDGAAALEVADAARIGPYQSLEELKAAVGAAPAVAEPVRRAEALLKQARSERAPESAAAQAKIREARALLTDAYARVQAPKPGEFRAVWCHDGAAYGMGWDRVIAGLAENGFNAVIPNMLWSGVAYYPSKVLPVHPVVAEKGDQLKALVEAAHAKGVQVHVWKVCWQFGWMADGKAAVPFRFDGRMQVSREGKQGEWLCPSHPRNRKYELDAIREVVSRYPIAGFQLDYIRYAGDEWCFCRTCKANFEEGLGKKLAGWPAPVTDGGKYEAQYLDWRRGVVTSFVREVRRMIRDVRPSCKLSAAVFPVPDNARNSVLQDWPRWVRDGLVDFVCPMNYTEDLQEMRSRLKAGLETVAGKVPVYPGLFATYGAGRDQEPDQAVAQVAAARELGAAGFVLFELEEQVLRDLLPVLRLGLTRE